MKSRSQIRLFTIGFTQTSARQFFSSLTAADVKRVIDVRLNNNSQLAGFSKKDDLEFFLKEIGNIEYFHTLDLAPTPEILKQYRTGKWDWESYQRKFLELIAHREIEKQMTPGFLENGCLLCSERLPHHCHRRLIAEYLNSKSGNIQIIHLT